MLFRSIDAILAPPLIDFGKFPLCKDIPIGVPRFDVWAIRMRITNIISGDSIFPKYIGCPPIDEINSVRHQVVSEMAYRYWLIDGKPDGRSEKHWLLAELDWCNALSGVWM